MPFGGGLWRNIIKGWYDFSRNISFKVGNWKSVNFWGHALCGDNY